MLDFELIPLEDIDPEIVGNGLFECLQDEATQEQLALYLPTPLAYGKSPQQARERVEKNQRLAREDQRFKPFVQMLGEEVIGLAVIDARAEAHKDKLPVVRKFIGKIATEGPSTSSWITSRRQGNSYGHQSLETRIGLATKDYGYDGLWTVVDNSNYISANNVTGRGFGPKYRGNFWVLGEHFSDAIIYQYLSD
ncbi:MAG: hypothetical protein WD061_02325 [Candidatus Saccharimonadales bacterium]